MALALPGMWTQQNATSPNLIGGYSGANRIDGGGGNDTVGGGDQADSLSGGSGDDVIFGGLGNDTLAGGAGMDRDSVRGGAYDSDLHAYVVDMSGFDVSGAAGTEEDQQGGLDFISGFEAVIIDTTPFSPDRVIGSAGDDIIFDSSGTDVLQGAAGDDVIYQTSEYLDGGSALDLRDTMDGGAGVDTLSFEKAFAAAGATGWAFDLKAGTVTGYNTGVDTVSSFEHVIGSAAEDTIAGSGAGETLEGGGSNDVIQGGGGADVLSGGEDADTFVYTSLADSGAGGRDLITDLAKEDVIDLSAIDADTTTAGDQAFHLVTGFTHHAGELMLTYNAATKTTLLAADVDGDGVADFSVNLAGDQHRFDHFQL
jgi:Ca2+-binding RTX toxin-like protein